MITLSQKIAQEFIKSNPGSNDKKFNKSISERCFKEIFDSELIPDIYKICDNDFCKCVICYEIEDSNHLSNLKKLKYCSLWFALDCEGWDLNLFPIYRDGTIGKIIDLGEIYYQDLFNRLSPEKVINTL